MPFTPSHAVVALPFLRTPLIPAAIAVGAMAPDLPLFVRGMLPSYARTHDFAWLPVTTLVALALLLLWRCVLRPVSRELAPRVLGERLPGEWDQGAAATLRTTFGIPAPGSESPNTRERGVSRFATTLLLLISLALGVATHIVWDLFTHEGRAGAELFPVLAEFWGPLAGYKWLQHASSVAGLLILAIWAALWFHKQPCIQRKRALPQWVRVCWWLSLPVLLVGAWVWGMLVFGPFTEEWTVQHLAYRVLPPASAIFGCITFALCLGIQHARRRFLTQSERIGR